MTANEKLLDDAITQAVKQQGLANSVARRMINLLNKADSNLMAQITKALEKLPGSSFKVQRLNSILESVRKINDAVYNDLETKLNAELKQISDYEIEHQTEVLSSVLAGAVDLESVSPQQVYAAAMAQPFQGKLLKEWTKLLSNEQMQSIRDAIAIGYTENETISQIVTRIRGTKALNYTDGILITKKRNVETIVRTAISHVANFSRKQIYSANDSVIKGVKWVATLDSRTTLICSSRDGKVYAIDKVPPIPAHFNCRSSTVPVLKSWRELGINADELSESTRSSLDGQVPAETTYQSWLKNKPASFQDEVLGKTKGQLFRKGDLPLDRFVNRQGYEYTIEQLRAKDAEAFKKAGL